VFGGNSPFVYLWNDGASQTDANATELVAGLYTVTVTDADNCTAIETTTVTSNLNNCGLTIPTVFSPNGDGVNDAWRLKGAEGFPELSVEIYNRWGSLVFSSVGYPEAWDGTRNGKNLPTAAYYYIIDLINGEEPLTGTVTIVR